MSKPELNEPKHIAELLIEYAMQQGCTPEILKQGIWISKVDDTWEIKCNGTQDKLDNYEPLSWYIYYNGWPAGVLSILGDGVLCSGDYGNEENLRAAIEKKISEVVISKN